MKLPKKFVSSLFSKRTTVWVGFYRDAAHNFHVIGTLPLSAWVQLPMFLAALGYAGIELAQDLKELGPLVK